MKLGVLRSLKKEDLAKSGDTPAWLDIFLQVFNDWLDRGVRALTNNLTFGDNFLCKELKAFTFTSGVEKVILIPKNNRVAGILVLEVLNKQITGHGFTRKSDGSIGITITWTGGGDASCRVIIFLE